MPPPDCQEDRKCFDKKRRVIEAIVPSSPAGMWNQDHLQRGDELVKLNGRSPSNDHHARHIILNLTMLLLTSNISRLL
ncbi:hypothetical protein AK812_SmicGene21378 [Symbiodinium microadriaticum]|uniref:PDZ domain-containing protein n=1 Tax=Symbiodinium microadriaticum TaxID=2951 RepID=A0A1Q9DMJ6_SYMMI|nr:hypothetical protein AK812_SmicGene21378 [Symbiodinium microadriaticum]